MARAGWHIKEEAGVLTLSRRLPARFDFCAKAGFAPVRSRRRLAMQIRQDMWRALRDLRGFAPVVQVWAEGDGMQVAAGGSVAGAVAKGHCEARVAALLADRDLRARWLARAGKPQVQR
ncbi:MAG: hypothetical protein ACRBBK_08330 [Paracoccaceae bacterium]